MRVCVQLFCFMSCMAHWNVSFYKLHLDHKWAIVSSCETVRITANIMGNILLSTKSIYKYFIEVFYIHWPLYRMFQHLAAVMITAASDLPSAPHKGSKHEMRCICINKHMSNSIITERWKGFQAEEIKTRTQKWKKKNLKGPGKFKTKREILDDVRQEGYLTASRPQRRAWGVHLHILWAQMSVILSPADELHFNN